MSDRVMADATGDSGAADTAGVVVRPPLLYLGATALGFGLDVALPIRFAPGGLDDALQYGIGGALILIAATVVSAAFRQFRAARTNLPTSRPTTALVTSGLFRLTRNPIYLSMSLCQAGIAVAADRVWILILLAPVLIVIRYGVIEREERYLERKFGDAYRDYKARVRRWL